MRLRAPPIRVTLALLASACIAAAILYAAGTVQTTWSLTAPRRRPFLNEQHSTSAAPLVAAGLAVAQAALLLVPRSPEAQRIARPLADVCHITAALVATCDRVTDLQLLVAWALSVSGVHRAAPASVLLWALFRTSSRSTAQLVLAPLAFAVSAARPLKPADSTIDAAWEVLVSTLLIAAACLRDPV